MPINCIAISLKANVGPWNNSNNFISPTFEILTTSKKVKFNESVDLAINLGVDPRHADQIVRGTVSLPHGTGKKLKVLVIAKGDKVDEAISE